jgi:hypothetical protein
MEEERKELSVSFPTQIFPLCSNACVCEWPWLPGEGGKFVCSLGKSPSAPTHPLIGPNFYEPTK